MGLQALAVMLCGIMSAKGPALAWQERGGRCNAATSIQLSGRPQVGTGCDAGNVREGLQVTDLGRYQMDPRGPQVCGDRVHRVTWFPSR